MLDGGPSRIPQPIDRRGVYRQEPARGRAGEVLPEGPEETQPPLTKSPGKKKPHNSLKRSLIWLLVAGVVIVSVLMAVVLLDRGQSAVKDKIDSSKYQAVFFANGQVYFGKLSVLDDQRFLLDDVFYIQSNITTGQDPDQPTTGDTKEEGAKKLVPLGNEVHGPANPMIITGQQIMFFENLKSDGRVSQLIQQYKAGVK